jgi:GAF domain-containing protein
MQAHLGSNRGIDETARLATLYRYQVLDTSQEDEIFNDLTELAAYICDTPIAMISLVDRDRQWFKSKLGIEASQTARDISFCTYAIQQRDLFIVPDATKDERFKNSPLVTQEPGARFYAGAPLVTERGKALGSLCVLDRKPRELTTEQQNALRALGRQTIAMMNYKLATKQLALANEALKAEMQKRREIAAEHRAESGKLTSAEKKIEALQELLPICMYCKNIRDDKGYWDKVESYIAGLSGAGFSHGICPQCVRTHFPQEAAEVLGPSCGRVPANKVN